MTQYFPPISPSLSLSLICNFSPYTSLNLILPKNRDTQCFNSITPSDKFDDDSLFLSLDAHTKYSSLSFESSLLEPFLWEDEFKRLRIYENVDTKTYLAFLLSLEFHLWQLPSHFFRWNGRSCQLWESWAWN